MAIFAEPGRWTALSTIIRAVEELEADTGRPVPVAMTFHDCILFLCFDAVKVSRYRIDAAAGIVDGDSIPGEGDFVQVTERWTIVAAEGGTRLELRAELEPAFSVPPLIGTLLLKSRLKKLLREMEENLARMPRSTEPLWPRFDSRQWLSVRAARLRAGLPGLVVRAPRRPALREPPPGAPRRPAVDGRRVRGRS